MFRSSSCKFCAFVIILQSLNVPVRNALSLLPPSGRRSFLLTTGGAATTFLKPYSPTAWALEDRYEVNPGSLVGKTIVITGATTGLGLESAKELAVGGATVILTARSEDKGKRAVEEVEEYLREKAINNASVNFVTLDLDALENVRGFNARLSRVIGDTTKIDVLLNNAGVMAVPDRQLTVDGNERTFQSNHLGHFLLTASLYSRLKGNNARIINVSSLGYQLAGGKLNFDNLNGQQSYGPWQSYGYSKLENILFTNELQKRADAAGDSLTVVSLHPGAVNTDLARNMIGPEQWELKKQKGPSNPFESIVDNLVKGVLLTIPDGAQTQVYLASTSEPIKKAAFYSNKRAENVKDFAKDDEAAQKLWAESERLCRVKFDL